MKQVTAFLVLIFLMAGDLSAQTPTDHEIGFKFNNFRDFSLIYKNHLKDNKYLRLRSFNTNFGLSSFSSSLNLGVAVGLENRRDLRSKLQLISGPELGAFYSRFNVKESEEVTHSYTFQLGYVIGLQYAVKDNIRFGFEAIPAVSTAFSYDEDGFVDNSNSISFTNGWGTASVFAVYTFNGKEK